MSFQSSGGDIGEMDLKRTLEEIKRLQAEASSLRQENIQLKTAENDDIVQGCQMAIARFLDCMCLALRA